jgi:hypothetical protein
MRRLVAFLRFWYDFIVGDDWRVAAGIAAGLAITAVVADGGRAAWWVLPLAVVLALAGALRRAVTATAASRQTPR